MDFVQPYGLVHCPFGHSSVIGMIAGSPYTVAEELKNERVAEARFLRAYNYFAMVKRYGGVPLITVKYIFATKFKIFNTALPTLDFILS